MQETTFLYPLGYFAIASASFCAAIHLPNPWRLFFTSSLLWTAVLSLRASTYLGLGSSVSVIWALLVVLWTHHVLSILILDPIDLASVSASRNLPKWVLAYKFWNDPRRLTDLESVSPYTRTRIGFVLGRLLKLICCWVLHIWVISPAHLAYFDYTSKDFGKSRQILVRRTFLSGYGPEITRRELQIRTFTSVFWIWTTFLLLDACHILLSILFVGILRFDNPEEWPSLFGNLFEAYSIRRFWSRFWHTLPKHACETSGRLVAGKVLKFPIHSRKDKLFMAFWAFLISGVLHDIADWQTEKSVSLVNNIVFFLANFAAGAIETVVVEGFRGLKSRCGNGKTRRTLESSFFQCTVGFLWVWAFFFWISPKWQYTKLHAQTKEMELLEWLAKLASDGRDADSVRDSWT
ncbi:hypothetical protein K491DRAFT_611843 [Lophiostoma macrostomum CBS 122681]|uniref:Wax synthase domain-containing protein n=1 Tax=Lophiostoma macrostomum CBS 122681 TaxID=1314788 RepID=A0A6A6SQM8_9PLEO|nr:hypothetical protein K491DRAFT_611843 [Lophiostoma macrostomum CBS 122681]